MKNHLLRKTGLSNLKKFMYVELFTFEQQVALLPNCLRVSDSSYVLDSILKRLTENVLEHKSNFVSKRSTLMPTWKC